MIAETDEVLLNRVVADFNTGARTGDFSALVDLLTDDAVLEFEGVPDPPFLGRDAIAEHYRNDPPDDEVAIVRSKSENGFIIANFVWVDIPEARGGTLIITPHEERVARIAIAFGGPSCWR